MAFTHIYFGTGTTHGGKLASALAHVKGLQELGDQIAVMATMMSGDGSQTVHFAEVTSRYGFSDDATSQSAWNELNSLWSKFSTDASITNALAARTQALAKFG